MATLQTRMHPGVVMEGPPILRRNRSAHLRQGQMTNVCGAYSVLMAVVVMGIAPKRYVRRLRETDEGDLLDPVWTKAKENFFSGLDHREMLALLDTLDRYVNRQVMVGSMRQVLKFTLDRLDENDVVVLGFGDRAVPGPNYWALAVGTESKVAGLKRTVTGVLCLDSVEPAPTLAPYNARLYLDSPKRGARQLHYRGQDGNMTLMTCTSAIALSRRP